MFAGVGRLLDAIERFRFDEETLRWLTSERIVSDSTVEFLSAYRFSGDIRGYREGELFFPGSPVLEVEGTFAEKVSPVPSRISNRSVKVPPTSTPRRGARPGCAPSASN